MIIFVTAEQHWLRSFCCGYIRWKMLQHLLSRLRSVPCIYSFLDIHLFKVSLQIHTSTFNMTLLLVNIICPPLPVLVAMPSTIATSLTFHAIRAFRYWNRFLSITCVNIKWNGCIRIDRTMKNIQDWMHRRNSRLISEIYHHRNKTPRFWQDIFNQPF